MPRHKFKPSLSLLAFSLFFLILLTPNKALAVCGRITAAMGESVCVLDGGGSLPVTGSSACQANRDCASRCSWDPYKCCFPESECDAAPTPTPTTTPPPATPTQSPSPTMFPAPKNQDFDNLNPLKIGGANDIADKAESEYAGELSTPGGIVSRVIKFLFPLAGLVLFVMLVWGGFEIMMGSISKKVDAGKQRVTAAIVGFLILFATYWIWQIIQVVFGVKVL